MYDKNRVLLHLFTQLSLLFFQLCLTKLHPLLLVCVEHAMSDYYRRLDGFNLSFQFEFFKFINQHNKENWLRKK